MVVSLRVLWHVFIISRYSHHTQLEASLITVAVVVINDGLILVYMGRNKFLQPHVPKWLTCVSFMAGINILAQKLK